jgi:hypothetical protein
MIEMVVIPKQPLKGANTTACAVCAGKVARNEPTINPSAGSEVDQPGPSRRMLVNK